MRSRNRIIALMIVLLMVLGISACSGNTSSNTDTTTPSSPSTTTPADNGGGTADNTVYNLVFTSHDTELTYFAQAIDEWADELKTESNGRLNIEKYYGGTLAAAGDSVDFVLQGGADICWNTVSLNPNQFKYIDILGAYGEKLTNSLLATYVLMGLIKQSQVISNEYTAPGLKILGVHSLVASTFSGIGDKITSLDQVKGKSMQSIGKNAINTLNYLGAAAIGVTPGDLYENYAKNVCSAALMESSLNESAKLYELIDYICTFNYNTSTAFVVMNQQKFDSLPPDLQQLLDSKYEYLSMLAAQKINDGFRNFIATKIPEYGIDVYDAPQPMVDASNALFSKVIEEPWRANCEAGGVDGDAIKAIIDALIVEGRAKYGPDMDWFK